MTNALGREVQVSMLPQDMDLCVQALGHMPYFQVAALIQKFARIMQAEAQKDVAARLEAGADPQPPGPETPSSELLE